MGPQSDPLPSTGQKDPEAPQEPSAASASNSPDMPPAPSSLPAASSGSASSSDQQPAPPQPPPAPSASPLTPSPSSQGKGEFAQLPHTASSTASSPQLSVPSDAQSDEKGVEQVWVERAKSVIARTSGDPSAQHEMVEKLRAQYLHERFGLDILTKQDG